MQNIGTGRGFILRITWKDYLLWFITETIHEDREFEHFLLKSCANFGQICDYIILTRDVMRFLGTHLQLLFQLLHDVSNSPFEGVGTSFNFLAASCCKVKKQNRLY